ncbi:hypothetical protein PR048_024070 [Dryococelus australis]|uniref:Uncharacterized protein n=1 Tax=Dryococelus australis TaxID=614101 RepID=A0ABQ9GVV8_9NEOP|nr:hypothetical protein PR048_024070 [Dryococelus australis]
MLAEKPLALCIHCAVHALNLALQDSSKSTPLILAPKRRAVISQIATDHSLTSSGPRPLYPTRWTVREASLSGVLNLYTAVLNFLDTLAYDLSDIGRKARGLLDQLLQGNVLFGIRITQIVFSLTENLSNILQSKIQTVAGAKEAVNL